MPSSRLARFARLPASDRRLLAEALGMLVVASLAIALLPFRRSILFGARRRRGPMSGDSSAAGRIGWAIGRAATALPWSARCFPQGIAAQRMLRRRGIEARLHYGIGRAPDEALAAHVWVTADDAVVVGGQTDMVFEPVAAYP